MRAWRVVAALAVLACAWALAEEPEGGRSEMEQLAQEAQRLEQQLEDADDDRADMLEMQIDQVHERLEELEREQEFYETRREHRERVWELEMEIAEIRHDLVEGEEETPQVNRDLAEARVALLEKLRDLSRQVATLTGPGELPKALELLEQMELAEIRWDMVDAPKLEGAARLHEMGEAAAEFGNPPELLIEIEKAEQLRQAVVADAEDLFARWRKHRQQRRELDETIDGFWQKVDQAHAGQERLP
jgi:hypothetical protein